MGEELQAQCGQRVSAQVVPQLGKFLCVLVLAKCGRKGEQQQLWFHVLF